MAKYYAGQTVFNTMTKCDEVVIGVSETSVRTSGTDGLVSDYDCVLILPMSSVDIEKKYHNIKCHTCKELAKAKEVSGDYPSMAFTDIYGNNVVEYPYFCPSCGEQLYEDEPIG